MTPLFSSVQRLMLVRNKNIRATHRIVDQLPFYAFRHVHSTSSSDIADEREHEVFNIYVNRRFSLLP